ncbi:uncharacterized protein LOC110117056 [Athalia rosae]|uniref:uncharacterized protein LOC110117056 n=1 Tax=Athalia rosae TaxID=37344 RepID=UPI0020342006|nr:uncharacterized protein LOC110117056 [Athalia rosae]
MKILVCAVLLLSIASIFPADEKLSRTRRLVGIRPGSKFFLRMNFKDAILNSTPIFAHVAGFKVAWDVPEGKLKFSGRRPIRAVLEDAEFLFNRHGFDGKSCLLNNICHAADYVSQKTGVVAKILRLLLRDLREDRNASVKDSFTCRDRKSSCPLNFIGFNAFLEK